MRVIILGSTLALRNAFVPAARKQRAETSEARNSRDGPTRVTACLMTVEIILGVTGFHNPLRKTDESGVRGEALARRSNIMIQTRVRTGQSIGSPLKPRPITSPLTPFFCMAKVKEAKVAQRSCVSEEVTRSRQWPPRKS